MTRLMNWLERTRKPMPGYDFCSTAVRIGYSDDGEYWADLVVYGTGGREVWVRPRGYQEVLAVASSFRKCGNDMLDALIQLRAAETDKQEDAQAAATELANRGENPQL